MNEPSVRGTVHFIDETKTYGQNGFRKRLVVLEQDKGKFTNYVPLEFTQERCDSVDSINVGDEIEVVYRLSGRKWQANPNAEVKYFLNADALEFRMVSGGSAAGGGPQSVSADQANNAFAEAADEIDADDVPF